MTKREFDAATKENYGCHWAGATRYRRERGHVDATDFVAQRAEFMAHRNAAGAVGLYGRLGTLELGSQFRAFAEFRRADKRPMLRLG